MLYNVKGLNEYYFLLFKIVINNYFSIEQMQFIVYNYQKYLIFEKLSGGI